MQGPVLPLRPPQQGRVLRPVHHPPRAQDCQRDQAEAWHEGVLAPLIRASRGHTSAASVPPCPPHKPPLSHRCTTAPPASSHATHANPPYSVCHAG
eukprot:3080224-Pyramimonas_sp.AAC.2